MADNVIIGIRIKQAREEKGLTQGELADALGLNKSTIQRYEAAIIEKIKLPIIDAIAQKLDVNPEWLSDKTDTRTLYLTDKPHIIELRAVDELPDDTPDKAESSSAPSDEDIKFALFDGSEGVTDEMYDEVKRFAKYIKEQKEKK